MSRDLLDRDLAAFRDGELPWLRRLAVERRLRRDPSARRRLEALEAVRALLREVDAEQPVPDLWEDVRLRLSAVDARRAEATTARAARGAHRFGWSALGAAAAAAATLALLVRLGLAPEAPAPVAPPGAVRWLDPRGQPMMVLRDDAEATIIWLPQPASDARTGALGVRDGLV